MNELLVYQITKKYSLPHFPHQNKVVLSLIKLNKQSSEFDSRKITAVTLISEINAMPKLRRLKLRQDLIKANRENIRF